MHSSSFLIFLATAALVLGGAVAAQATTEVESRTSTETFSVESPARLVVDNLAGSIRVIAHDGDTITATIEETVRAEDASGLAKARRETSLKRTVSGNEIRLVLDGPFRHANGINFPGWDALGYELRYDFVVRVPRHTDLELSTVNDGDITVEGVTGDLEVANTNGGIHLEGIGGSGRFHTTNGNIEVAFAENPDEAVSLQTVNGDLTATFQPRLAAELQFSLLNGEISNDFAQGSQQRVEATGGSPTRVKTRVAEGGPTVSFQNTNGKIRVQRGSSAR